VCLLAAPSWLKRVIVLHITYPSLHLLTLNLHQCLSNMLIYCESSFFADPTPASKACILLISHACFADSDLSLTQSMRSHDLAVEALDDSRRA
jgi:hypothetical protein